MITVAVFTLYNLLPGYFSKHYTALFGNKASYIFLITETCVSSVRPSLIATYIMNKRNSQKNLYQLKSLLCMQ